MGRRDGHIHQRETDYYRRQREVRGRQRRFGPFVVDPVQQAAATVCPGYGHPHADDGRWCNDCQP